MIDGLQGVLCKVLDHSRKRGDHLAAGQSACTWAAAQCRMSKTSAADRLCVGQQLEELPAVEGALSEGQIGYQSAAVICHLSEQLGDTKEMVDEEMWISFAQKFSIKELRYLAHEARARWDPDHRLVHEEGWQVILASDRVEFISPERPILTRRRGAKCAGQPSP